MKIPKVALHSRRQRVVVDSARRMIQDKVWGTTELLFARSGVEVHRIVGRAGMQCSLHRHRTKFNAFYVERGALRIHAGGRVERLGPGQQASVVPGAAHRFEVVEEGTVAFEIYWSEMEPQDIERLARGGPVEQESAP